MNFKPPAPISVQELALRREGPECVRAAWWRAGDGARREDARSMTTRINLALNEEDR